MLSVSTQLRQAIDQSVELSVSPIVYAEWEMSGYYDYTVSGATSIDDEVFPLSEVFLPNRPLFPGAPKAVANATRVAGPVSTTKYRMATEDSPYKYFRSKAKSVSGGAISGVAPTIVFAQDVKLNKLVLQFENATAQPTSVTVSLSTNGSTWASAGNFSPDANGQLVLYYNGTAWTTTRVLGNYVTRRGVRVTVNTMPTAAQAVDIIAISPRLEVDLTPLVKNVSTNVDREEVELDSPVGVMQANVADISLDNSDGRFNPHNTLSEYYGIIDENVRLHPWLRVRRSDGQFEDIRQGVFFSDDWSVNDDGTVTVNCTDQSKFLQEPKMSDCFFENKTAEYIIDDILERHGFGRAIIRASAKDAGRRIPYVWFTPDQSIWEALTQLARAEQASFYFNEDGQFVYETRDWLFSQTTPQHELRAVNDGVKLANIESLNTQFTVAANDVTVEYTKYEPNDAAATGKDNVLWSLQDDAILRIRPLARAITSGTGWFSVGTGEGEFWPLEGVVNIEGEYIRYTRDTANPDRLNIVKRGEYGSPIFDHTWSVKSGWNFWSRSDTSRIYGNNSLGSVVYPREESVARLIAGSKVGNTISSLNHGNQSTSFQIYGTSLQLAKSGEDEETGVPIYTRGHGWGGIKVQGDGWAGGVYFELRRAGSTDLKGFGAYAIVNGTRRITLAEVDYEWKVNQRVDMMVSYERATNSYVCYLDGRQVAGFQYYSSALGKDGVWGPFIRGNSTVDFHHFYTINNWAVAGYDESDMLNWQDRVSGGFAGGYALREWAGSVKRRASSEWFFDDFGALVREAREYDVRHDVFPARTSDVFLSNDTNISVVHHKKTNFASKLAIVNSSFRAALIHGNQQIDEERSLSHEMFIHGDPIVETAEETVQREDPMSIRRRGRKELVIESPWVQTKSRANRIAEFIVQRWGEPVDMVSVETIIIPHMQVGDLVSVSYPRLNMSPATHRYHVIAIDRTYGSDHSQSVTLRRAYS
jgi:hypothetical protein